MIDYMWLLCTRTGTRICTYMTLCITNQMQIRNTDVTKQFGRAYAKKKKRNDSKKKKKKKQS